MDAACCCCEYCIASTFSEISKATVTFSGSPIDSHCTTCSALTSYSFELSNTGVDAGGTWPTCCYYLEGDLLCGSGSFGYDWIQFCYYAQDATNLIAEVTMHFYVDSDEGWATWNNTSSPISWDSLNPNQYDCSTSLTLSDTEEVHTGLIDHFYICDFSNTTAYVVFS